MSESTENQDATMPDLGIHDYDNDNETGAGHFPQRGTKTKAKRWMITSWQSKADVERVLRECLDDIESAVLGEEKAPTTGKQHVHVAIIFKNRLSARQVKNLLTDQTAHVEIMRGRWSQVVKYVCKEDKHIVQLGEDRGLSDKQDDGRQEFFQSIMQEPTVDHLKQSLLSHPKYAVHTNVALKLISLFGSTVTPKDTITVSYFYGNSGSGKSTKAHELLAGKKYSSCTFTDGGFVNGYQMTKDVIFDDINVKSQRFPVEKLLQYLDKWPCSVDVKGGELPWLAENIIITRCEPPNTLHRFGWKMDDERQFLRRITHLYFCWKDEEGNYKYQLQRQNIGQKDLIMPQIDMDQNP